MKQEEDNNDLRLISISEACERLCIGHWSMYKLINQNAIKTVKIGTRRLISNKSLNDFITKLETENVA